MDLLNVLEAILESSTFFLVLIILLIIVSLSMFYLIYSQNKALSGKVPEKQISNQKHLVEQVEQIEDMNAEVRIENDNMLFESVSKIPVQQEPELIELTNEKIPDELEYTQALWENDSFDLKSVTQELESLPREKTIKLTPYEAEQEEKAIISYDELISQTSKININFNELDKEESEVYVNPVIKENVSKQIDNSKFDTADYEHEEAFLEALKQLQQILN